MDFAQPGAEMSREQEMISTKKRLETFQFCRTSGSAAPAPLSSASSVGRSHSRHGSVSSASLSGSISVLTTYDQPSLSSSDSRPSSFVGRPRPTSHHRRRSSVSTRAESAEMMGITIPDLPVSTSDDNINFGDKDSVRRRALQALEGRSDLSFSSSTVEIPEFSSQGIPQKLFDREFKLPTSVPSFGMSALSGKRDSLGKYLSSASSLKDQLHTLMEEEEEDEEQKKEVGPHAVEVKLGSPLGGEERRAIDNDQHDAPERSLSVDIELSKSPGMPPSSVAGRPRPANLTLRPLSLMSSVSNPSLSTPSLTPNLRTGLRASSLVTHSDSNLSNPSEGYDAKWASQTWKQKTSVHSSSSSLSSSASNHQTSSGCGSSCATSPNSKRQTSISYIRSGSGQSQPTAFTLASLPTPGATPTSERRQSTSSISSFGSISNQERRNASEDMFLHQSHASLLARIAELELALQSRSRSRSASTDSNSSANAPGSPPDEMLRLVADLKAERDELNKDIDGWRQRVGDLEHARTLLGHDKAVLERRLEAEKREGWLKDEKLGLLEMEKGTLNRELAVKEEDISNVNRKLESTQAQLHQARLECESLREDAEVAKRQLAEAHLLLGARRETETELLRLREALAAEQIYRGKLIGRLDTIEMLETPRVAAKITNDSFKRTSSKDQSRTNGFGFQSVDSACTTVDADEATQQALRAPFTLKAVEEESELHHESISDDEDELARYEEEDDLSVNITSPTRSMSSYDSDDGLPRSLSHLCLAASSTPVSSNGNTVTSRSLSSTPSPTSSPCPTPIPPLVPEVSDSGHGSRASLSRTWTFPRGGQAHSPRPSPQEVDRFFGCLEDIDNSPPVDSCHSMDDRKIFSQRLRFGDLEDEDLPPFVLPAQKVAGEVGSAMLEVVLEENEEDLQCDASDGRRKTSLPLSVSEDSLSRTSSPLFEDHLHMKSVPFIFPQMKVQGKEYQPVTPPLGSRTSEAEQSSPSAASLSAVDDCSSNAAPSNVTNSRSVRPSQIPPPSPRLIQAKSPTVRWTPSPPGRNPAPASGATHSSLSRLKPLGAAVGSPRGGKKSVPALSHGSSYIPQRKVTSSPDFRESKVGAVSYPTTSAMKCDVDGELKDQDSNDAFILSSQPLLQTFTNFFPLRSFPWAKNHSHNNIVVNRKPIYAPKERQLAKLRADMVMRPAGISRQTEIIRCCNCRDDLISL